MRIHFSIEYKTKWGESLRVQLLGEGGSVTRELQLGTTDGIRWEGDAEVDDTAGILTYRYAAYSGNALIWTEWEVAPHIIRPCVNVGYYLADDLWRPIPADLPLYSSAYTDCIAPHADAVSQLAEYETILQLRVVEPHLDEGEYLAVIGNTKQFGEWRTPIRMSMLALQEWGVNMDASLIYQPVEYKYVIVDSDNHIKQWEDGVNRRIESMNLRKRQAWIKSDWRPTFKKRNWKCAGVVVPVFSLRSENSFGVGDFGDLKAFIRWASSVDMRVVQILPVNDTTMTKSNSDSYPYSAISIYALHPIYCDLLALGKVKNRLKMEEFLIRRQELNDSPTLRYEDVYRLKEEYLREMYVQEGGQVLATQGFKDFFSGNAYWLKPYAAFSCLRDKFGTAEYSEWKKYSRYSKGLADKMCEASSDFAKDMNFYFYVQYELHLQMLDVRHCARESKVIIKGDIPIGINRNSVESWSEPHYFNLGQQAGAPPDDFAENGQNWGFPTYNWEVMRKDGYRWWLNRFTKMAEYFDAYRIDHVLGFFRIWSIPLDSVQGLLGQFSPSLPMSRNEIESFGLTFDADSMTAPYIDEVTLDEVFGYRKEMIKILYLDKLEGGMYRLKKDYDTQRKIERAFANKSDDESSAVRSGLYTLTNNVLFVRDMDMSDMYHPRIMAQKTTVYRLMPESERGAFDRLYEEYFYHRHDQYWYKQAMRKLPMLTQATRMLVCAEDLGMVPGCVPWVMEQLRILSLEIQTMPKACGMEFGLLQQNPYLSVATISTHDMPTLRMWWEEDHDRAQRYYNFSLNKDGMAPETLPGWLCEDIIVRYLFCPSMLCLLSLQDWLSMDESIRNPDTNSERINIPADPNHYWCWRMHLKIEDLMSAGNYNKRVRTLISYSGRD